MAQIVFCADDFTGASDTLATLARAGLAVRLYLSPPPDANQGEITGLDAYGVATSLRAQPVSSGKQVMSALAADLHTGDAICHFKVCSTFDSSPQTGNIAAIADCFAEKSGAGWIAVLGGQPSLGRYCLFGNLFARASDGKVHRIDRHPVMARHPVTPMLEADLALHLGQQGWPGIGLIDFTTIRKGADALIAEITRRIATGERQTLFDVGSDDDLAVIGTALRAIAAQTPILCVGASSVAQALTAQTATSSPDTNTATAPKDSPERAKGPAFIFAGSRSNLTARQVAETTLAEKIAIDPIQLVDERQRSAICAQCSDLLQSGANVLLYVTDRIAPDISSHRLANASARLIADICKDTTLGILAIAGGDTSSIAVQALGIDSLSFVADFDQGVPMIRAHAQNNARLDGLPMLLKGGQMGRIDMFDTICKSGSHPPAPANG